MAASFHDLSEDRAALVAALSRMGLCAAGEDVRIQPLTGGVSSNVLLIAVGARRLCLKQALPQLKVAKEWLAPIERVFGEIDWLRTAAAIEPTLVPAVLGVDRPSGSFAMAYLAPASHPNWKARLLAGEVDPGFASVVGARLGHIHSATAHQPQLAQTFATDATFHALRLEPYLEEIARVHPAQAAAIHSVLETTWTTRLALVHGDVSPKNILIGPSGPVLLDAECAWWGDPAFDLAFCLNHLLLKSVKLPDRAAALRESFQRLAGSYLAAVDWEAPVALEGRAAALLACLLLARIDGKSPVEYLDRFQRAAVRAIAVRLVEEPPARLGVIAAAFNKE